MIDGWLLRVSIGGSVNTWLVKGYMHPEGHVVAVPYKKENFAPFWLYSYVPCLGRYVSLVPKRNIVVKINPFQAFRLRKNDIPKDILELVEILDAEAVGITGSWALNNEREDSDVDLIIYDENLERVYNMLRKLREDGLIFQCRREKEMFNKVEEPWIVEEYKKVRVLESCYKGIPYTIRLLRSMHEIPCLKIVLPLGNASKLLVKIINNRENYLVPARYEVKILEGPSWITDLQEKFDKIVLETWRTRYQELKTGVYEVLFSDIILDEDEVIISVDPQGKLRKHPTARNYGYK